MDEINIDYKRYEFIIINYLGNGNKSNPIDVLADVRTHDQQITNASADKLPTHRPTHYQCVSYIIMTVGRLSTNASTDALVGLDLLTSPVL